METLGDAWEGGWTVSAACHGGMIDLGQEGGEAMSRRKGELTKAGINQGWPHQVALIASRCTMKQGDVIREFCVNLSLCDRGHSVIWEDEWYNVYCFAKREDAEAFLERFGGEWFDHRDKGSGHYWHFWYKGRGAAKDARRAARR